MKNLTILVLCFCAFLSACKKQIEFDAQKWQNGKYRYEMAESLIKKLEKEKPSRTEVEKILGIPEVEGNIGEKSLTYFLKSDAIIGFAMYQLAVHFDEGGTFEKAEILYTD